MVEDKRKTAKKVEPYQAASSSVFSVRDGCPSRGGAWIIAWLAVSCLRSGGRFLPKTTEAPECISHSLRRYYDIIFVIAGKVILHICQRYG
jgi:hypothetical protein